MPPAHPTMRHVGMSVHTTHPTSDRHLLSDTLRPTIRVERWTDPVVDRRGHDPRSLYVERFWLGAIGPSATWIMRRLADRFDDNPHGFTLRIADLGAELGMSTTRGEASPFGRALQRCVMFGLARRIDGGLAVRRRLPNITRRQLDRLPAQLVAAHDDHVRRTCTSQGSAVLDALIAAGIHPRTAAMATERALVDS